jgi:hypothetical protein
MSFLVEEIWNAHCNQCGKIEDECFSSKCEARTFAEDEQGWIMGEDEETCFCSQECADAFKKD